MDALPPLLEQHLGTIRALCEKYRVKRLAVFGSAAQGTWDPATSDFDFVVEFEWHPDPLERGRRYNELWKELKAVLHRNIDLVVAATISNSHLAATIRESERDLYAA